MLTRSQRRAISRDDARKHLIAAKPSQHGAVARWVNAPRRMWPTMDAADVMPRGGQARINAKRNQRAELWRTVKVRVSAEMEPYFRRTLHLLGKGARIQGRREQASWFGVELDVHIPGAPAHAVRAEPVYYSDWNGELHVPRLDYVVFQDAAGRAIHAPNA